MAAAIAESLLHFIWQGTALGLLAYLVLRRVGDHPAARYAVGIGTLVAMALAPVVTSLWLLSDGVSSIVAGQRSDAVAAANTVPVTWVLSLWASGVTVCMIRLAGGWMLARGIATRAAAPVSREVGAMASRIAARLLVTTPFIVLESAVAATPLMVGWLKPVILLPSAAIAGLAPSQLEALLAHELSHIRRHDYIVNLLQSIVESLLFFHPAVWLVSREVREAREQCCDDLTVTVCDRLVYVSALSSVAGLRAASPALAAGGGSLRRRVQRILHPQPTAPSAIAWVAVAPIALVLAAALPVSSTPGTVVTPAVPTAAVAGAAAPTPEPAATPAGTSAVVRTALPQAPRPVTAEMSAIRPALPVVLNYFTMPTQAMELQVPPPSPPPVQERQDSVVVVQGHVVKPGEYRMASGEMTVSKALAAAGGFAHSAGESLEILRPDGRGVMARISVTRMHLGSGVDPQVLSGDVVMVSGAPVFFVNGEVRAPGQKIWRPGMTVLKAVAFANGMTERGKFGHIDRAVKDDQGRILRYVRIMNLKPETEILPDDLLVMLQDGSGPSSVVIVEGQVVKPGEKRLRAEEMTLLKSVAESGGFLPFSGDVEIRRVGVSQAINITKTQLQAGADLPLLEGDTVVVRQGHVFFVNGEVKTPGIKVWAPGMTVLKAVNLAHGMTSQGKFSHINRAVKDETGKILKYQKITNLKAETEILPDDQLIIARKWFGE